MRILLSFVSSVGDFVLTKCFKTEDEVRDAVLVTDGDSEMGQVCLPFFFSIKLYFKPKALLDKLMHQNLEVPILHSCYR